MGIGIERKRDASVSKLLGDHLGRHARGQRQGRRGVAQIVEPDSRQFCAFQNASEVAENEISLIECVPVCVGEDQINRFCWHPTARRFLRRRATVFLHKLDHPLLELDDAPAARTFRYRQTASRRL